MAIKPWPPFTVWILSGHEKLRLQFKVGTNLIHFEYNSEPPTSGEVSGKLEIVFISHAECTLGTVDPYFRTPSTKITKRNLLPGI